MIADVAPTLCRDFSNGASQARMRGERFKDGGRELFKVIRGMRITLHLNTFKTFCHEQYLRCTTREELQCQEIPPEKLQELKEIEVTALRDWNLKLRS